VRLGGNEKVDLIRRAPLFARCSRRQLEEIAKIADEIDLAAGKEMTRQGEAGREFFVILEGTADVEKDGETINTLGSGDFFGEIALLSEEPRTATVRATSPVRALVITSRSFRRLLDESPEIKENVTEAMADRVAPDSI
jgi:CRP/FNR family cyclic AMP-dependent transcriptional regulator